MNSPLLKAVVLVLVLVCVFLSLTLYVKGRNYEKAISALTSVIADKDRTIETQKGVYERLAVEINDVSVAMDRQRAEVGRLYDELKRRGDQLLTANSLVVRWKKAYEAEVAAHQSEVPLVRPEDPTRIRVDFSHDFGYIGVTGHTVTSPPEAHVKIEQLRPLKLSLVVSQDSSKKWRTSVTSSEENVGVDIVLAAVNPWFFSPRWYEKIGIGLSAGLNGSDALVGASVDYDFGGFDLGPAAWFSTVGEDPYYGLSARWHPFKRD